MMIDPATQVFGVDTIVAGGDSNTFLTIEYAVLNGVDIESVRSIAMQTLPFDAEDDIPGTTTPLPAVAAGRTFKIIKAFVVSNRDAQTIGFTIYGLGPNPPTQGGFFGAVLDSGEKLVYNNGEFTIYTANGDVRVPA